MKMQLKANKFVGCRLHCNRFIVYCSSCFLNGWVCGVRAPCSQIKLLQFRCNTIMQRTPIAWTGRGCGGKKWQNGFASDISETTPTIFFFMRLFSFRIKREFRVNMQNLQFLSENGGKRKRFRFPTWRNRRNKNKRKTQKISLVQAQLPIHLTVYFGCNKKIICSGWKRE